MRKVLSTVFLILQLCAFSYGAKRPATAFAIITDSRTYAECSAEIDAYASVLEEEGLKTYIVSGSWNSPEEVKARIIALSRKKPVLEGIVLIGDIPVVMVRGAQSMTTAFRMDEEKHPFFESSVASDRFYDDFDLRFKFLKKDEDQDGVFYYKFAGKNSVEVRPDIYSARMKVPAVMEADRYEILRRYLRKVVAAHKEQGNTLDRMAYFAGYAYNSDCLTVWRQKPVLFKEAFPYAFLKASGNRFLNFRENSRMKWNLLNEIQRPGTDVFEFSEHGTADTQYINSGEECESFEDCLYLIKSELARSYRKITDTAEREKFLCETESLYHIDRSAFSDSALVSYSARAAEDSDNAKISAQELLKVRSEPKIVILNACFNASFHNPDGYIAGCHVFGDGGCVVAQGNTVNVLQDKWEDKLIGYLSIGERVGMWQKEFCWLETHLIGDPTFRFASHDADEAAACAKLHKDLVFNGSKADVWKAYAASDKPLERAAGIVHLGHTGSREGSEIALHMLENDPSPMVRLHALNVLWKCGGENAVKGAVSGLNDPYEAVVRTAARMIAELGDERAFEALEATSREHPEMVRVAYQAERAKNKRK